MKITCLRVNKEKVDSLEVQDGKVVGETEKKARRITLLGQALREGIRRVDWEEGLCVRRFSENMTIASLPPLQVGQTLGMGSLTLRILAAGKSCFPECRYVQRGMSCPLAEQAYFAEATGDGRVDTGDAVEIIG